MGKQSSRIFYQNKDHRDVVFQNNCHSKMYKGNQLVWEKLVPDEYFVLSSTDLFEGLHILNLKEKYMDKIIFADMNPHENSNLRIAFTHIGCLENVLFGTCLFDTDGGCLAYSSDGITWNKIQGMENATNYLYNLSNTNGTVQFQPWTIVDNSIVLKKIGTFTIFAFSNNGKFIHAIELDNVGESTDYHNIMCGNSKYYDFYYYKNELLETGSFEYRLYVKSIDVNGNLANSTFYKLGTHSEGIISLNICTVVHAGNTMYVIGSSSIGRDIVIGRINNFDHTTSWGVPREGFRLRTVYVIYADDNETVVAVTSMPSFSTIINEYPVLIISFKEDTYRIMNVIEQPIAVKDAKSNKIYDVNIFSDRGTVLHDAIDITNELGQSFVYMKNKKLNVNKNNGICYYGAYANNSKHKACVYFDNIYFLESKNNFTMPLEQVRGY